MPFALLKYRADVDVIDLNGDKFSRCVYVEAVDERSAKTKILAGVALVYDANPSDMIIKTGIISTHIDREFVLRGLVYWSDTFDCEYDKNPLFLSRKPFFNPSRPPRCTVNLTREHPWTAMGISRRTWYRGFRPSA